MKKFLVLLNAPTASFDAAMAAAPTGRAAGVGMKEWEVWMKKNMKSITYNGGPVGKNARVSASGKTSARNEVGGFLVIEAESADAASKMFADNPHPKLIRDGYIDIMEVMPMPGM